MEEILDSLPWYVKVAVGIGGVGVLVMLFDILNLLELFLYIVVIPFALLRSIGLIGEGLYEPLASGQVFADLKDRISAARVEIAAAEARAEP